MSEQPSTPTPTTTTTTTPPPSTSTEHRRESSVSASALSANELLWKGNYQKFYGMAADEFRGDGANCKEMLVLTMRDVRRALGGGGGGGGGEDALPEGRRIYLVQTGLSKMVPSLMFHHELNADAELCPLVFDLLCAIVDLLVLEEDEESLLNLLKLVNADLKFYTEYREEASLMKKLWGGGSKAADSSNDPLKVADASTGPPISPFYLRVVNQFAAAKGFDLFLQRLSRQEPRPTLPVIRLILKIILKMHPWVRRDFMLDYVGKLKNPTLEQLTYYTENRTHEQTLNYEGCNDVAVALLELRYTETELEQEFLEFQLRGAINNIRSSVLERKLHGVKYVNLIVKRAQKWLEKENTGRIARFANWLRLDEDEDEGVGPGQAPKAKPVKPLDAKVVLSWIAEHRVLDELLQLGAHEAIVRQAIPVLVFVAANDASLDTTKYVSVMWNISLDQHESVRSIICTSILRLSENLPLSDVEFIYGLLRKLTLDRFDDQMLDFLRPFTIMAITKFAKQSKRYLGLDIYWELFQDRLPGPAATEKDKVLVPTDVLKRASGHFATILEMDICQAVVPRYMEMLVHLMREGHSLTQALKLFIRLAVVQEAQKKKRTVEQLDEKLQLMDTVFAAIRKYKEGVTEASLKAESHPSKYGRRYLHLQVVQAIFDFLEWILVHTSLRLSLEQVDVLWKLFVDDEHGCPELMYDWLSSTSDEALSDQVVAHIFEKKLIGATGAQPASWTKTHYKVFERFFIRHNVVHKGLVRVNEGGSSVGVARYSAAAPSLAGLDELWTFALESRFEEVALMAADLLNEIFVVPRRSQPPRPSDLRERYVGRCMSACAKPSSHTSLLRALAMLRNLLDSYARLDAGAASSSSSSSSSSLFTFFVRVESGNGFLMTDVNPNTSLEGFKGMIAERLQMSPVFLKLLLEDREILGHPKDTLARLRIPDKGEIVVQTATANKEEITFDTLAAQFVQGILRGLGLRTASPSGASVLAVHAAGGGGGASAASQADETGIALRLESNVGSDLEVDSSGERPPAGLLSSPAHFEALYELLSHQDADVVAAAWRLLDRLPPAGALRSAFMVPKPAFEKLLESGTGYRLVYALQILESLCFAKNWPTEVATAAALSRKAAAAGGKAAAAAAGAEKAASWRRATLNNGGLQSLLELIPKSTGVTRLLAVRVVKALLRDDACKRDCPSEVLVRVMTMYGDTLQACAQAPEGSADQEATEAAMRCAEGALDLAKWGALGLTVSNPLAVWVKACLVEAKSESARFQTQRVLAGVTSAHPASYEQVRQVLFDELLPQVNDKGVQSVQLLGLLEKFARSTSEPGPEASWRGASQVVARAIRTRGIVEESSDPGQEDWCLAALLQLMQAILARFPSLKGECGPDLVPYLFKECLFALPDPAHVAERLQPPKCKTDVCRGAAFQLLVELARGTPANFTLVAKHVWQQGMDLTERHRLKGDVATAGKPRGPVALIEARPDGNFSTHSDSWMVSSMVEMRPRGSYMGLQNLGATCYMNSLLQQLYWAPHFAESVLSVVPPSLSELPGYQPVAAAAAAQAGSVAKSPSPSAPPSNVTTSMETAVDDPAKEIEGDKEEAPVDPNADHLLVQFQTMFASLRYGNRKFFNTRAFALANKDFDGNPINTGIQQDAIEYFNSLFERLEFFCGPDKQRHRFLREVFGGILSNQLICRDGCTHSKERKEPFYSISVDIKNKLNLSKSLELYVEGEMLEGDNAYFCDECKEKRPTLRRAVVHALPNTLVIHLKRFEFSYETLTYSKLNQYFEFPEELDMFPFTAEGLAMGNISQSQMGGENDELKSHPDAYYKYRLHGVVIHSGGAQGGHYYSLVKGPDGAWREFNDSVVRSFDFANMKEEAFGGSFTKVMRDMSGAEQKVTRERIHNAYLLVYERVQNFPFVDDAEATGAAAPVDSNVAATTTTTTATAAATTTTTTTTTPETTRLLIDRVYQDNVANVQGRYLSSPQYNRWLWDVLNLFCSEDDQGRPERQACFRETLSLTTFLLLHVMGRSRDTFMGTVWSGHVARMCANSQWAADWFLRRMVEGGLDDGAPEQPRFHYLYDFLCRCPKPRTRTALVEILRAAMKRISQGSPGWITRDTALDKLPADVTGVPTPLASAAMTGFLAKAPLHVQLVDRILVETPSLLHSLQFMSDWFRVLRIFSETGPLERQYLVSRGAVEYLLELITLTGRFNMSTQSKSIVAMEAVANVQRFVKNTSHAMGCVVNVVRGAHVPGEAFVSEIVAADGGAGAGSGGGGAKSARGRLSPTRKAKEPPVLQKAASPLQLGAVGELVPLPHTTWKLLVGREFIQRLLSERHCVSEVMELIEYLCWEDSHWSEYWFALLVDGVKRTKQVDNVGGFLLGFEALTNAADSLQANRVRNVGNFMLQMMERALKSKGKQGVAEVIKYSGTLVTMAKSGPPNHPLRKFVLSHEREIQDMRMEVGFKPISMEGV